MFFEGRNLLTSTDKSKIVWARNSLYTYCLKRSQQELQQHTRKCLFITENTIYNSFNLLKIKLYNIYFDSAKIYFGQLVLQSIFMYRPPNGNLCLLYAVYYNRICTGCRSGNEVVNFFVFFPVFCVYTWYLQMIYTVLTAKGLQANERLRRTTEAAEGYLNVLILNPSVCDGTARTCEAITRPTTAKQQKAKRASNLNVKFVFQMIYTRQRL